MKAKGSQIVGMRTVDDGRNNRTRIVAAGTCALPPDVRALFIGAYDAFASACRDLDEPGLAIVAVDERTRQVAGLTILRALPGRHAAAIVGRHDACDLVLTASDALPLRQLVVILDPVSSWQAGHADLEYRILDLRTEHGFQDEHGRALRGLRCDGPAVLRCAGHALYVLPVGDPTDWPPAGADAWACQPERVYFDEVTHVALGTSVGIRDRGHDRGHRTHVTAIHGPRATGTCLVVNSDLVGTLELTSPNRTDVVMVGQAALRDGVLIGRYPRCDRTLLGDESVSRVHALLIQIGDQVLAVDTASTNGTVVGDGCDREPRRVHAIDGDLDLTLGFETRARWRWLS